MKRNTAMLMMTALLWLGFGGGEPSFAASVERWTPSGGRSRKCLDDDTLVKRWIAAEMGCVSGRVETVRPVARSRNGGIDKRGKRSPVEAVRCSVGEPAFEFEFGELGISCYGMRIIAMVKTEDLQNTRKPVRVHFTVNDKIGGGETTYRHLVPYWDDFYCVTTFYFNVDEARRYRGRLTLGEKTRADLHVHSFEFHDVLKDLARRAGKKGPSLFSPAERDQLRKASKRDEVIKLVRGQVDVDRYLKSNDPPLTGGERVERDDLLWNAFPPINSQYVQEYNQGWAAWSMRAEGRGRKEVAAKHGEWKTRGSTSGAWHSPLEFQLRKGRDVLATYTRDDLVAGKPLPDPYPYKDDGLGVYSGEGDKAEVWGPIATALGYSWEGVQLSMGHYHGGDYEHHIAYLYHALGDERAARDAGLMLAKWAHVFPTFTDAQLIGHAMFGLEPQYKRDERLIGRRFMYYRPINLYQGLIQSYDYLFDYIDGNQELAAAVGRYIPWVKTDDDVKRLIETRILQLGAKRILRYHYWTDKGTPGYLMHTIAVQQDPGITAPWMEQLWTKTYVYPNPQAGLPDYITTTTQRDGTTEIGSVFYTHGGSAYFEIIKRASNYVASGGDPKYDLSDMDVYRKIVTGCSFPLDSAVAGGFPMTIGDVGSPAKPRMIRDVARFADQFRLGWKWSKDKRFAWLLAHYLGRLAETDGEWAEIEAAAKEQGRNPYLAQTSRVMSNWSGILESGRDSDDYRFKRTIHMRVGYGHGHAHGDTLDLQMVAHGCRMMNDVGWRGAYSMPRPSTTILHNRVEVNGKAHPFRGGQWQGHAWIDTFKPHGGCQYMHGSTVPPGGNHKNVSHFCRSVALVDVDEGTPPGGRPPEGLYRGAATRHDPDVKTPNSYVFDVQRVAGGTWHGFCFHGTWSDEFQVNAENVRELGQASHDNTAQDASPEAAYMRKFLDGPGLKKAGDAPATVVATWRLRRAEETLAGKRPHGGEDVSRKQINAEKRMLGADYDEAAPRKFTRLHLFGREGERVLTGHLTPENRGDATWPFLVVSKMNENPTDSVYPAVVEAYAGAPFIESAKLVDVPGAGDGAMRAVAVEVRTTNGHTDLCFSDGEAKPRTVGGATICAHFACVSRDEAGLRLVHLVKGTQVSTDGVRLEMKDVSYEAGIEKVEFLKRRIHLDAELPSALLAGEQVEIGNDRHTTSYTIAGAETVDGKTVLTFDKAFDLSYAHVTSVDTGKRQVKVTVTPMRVNGASEGLTCTNEDITKSWKCALTGGRGTYQLGSVFAADDFPVGSVFRLWEFGPGDTVRIATHAHLSRAEDAKGEYVLRANATVDVSLEGAPGTLMYGLRGGEWRAVPTTAKDGLVSGSIGLDVLTTPVVRLKIGQPEARPAEAKPSSSPDAATPAVAAEGKARASTPPPSPEAPVETGMSFAMIAVLAVGAVVVLAGILVATRRRPRSSRRR